MQIKKNYISESQRLAKAIDIALESFRKFPPKDFSKDNIDHVVKVYSEWKTSVLNPEPQFKNTKSLKYISNDVFTFFQESDGETVDFFWQQILENNLGYYKDDKLRKILVRGKIKGKIEFDYVTDIIVAVSQKGLVTEEETKKLACMLATFENKNL